MSLATHIAIACGFLTFMHPGFARADEISKVQAQVKVLSDSIEAQRVANLRNTILEVRQKQCGAAAEVRALYTESLQNMLIEYETLTKQRYPLPDCASF